ncbi:hypothetical protein [Bradyrhizobium sp.]
MSTISVKEMERNRGKTAALNHVSVASANHFRGGEEDRCFALGAST